MTRREQSVILSEAEFHRSAGLQLYAEIVRFKKSSQYPYYRIYVGITRYITW